MNLFVFAPVCFTSAAGAEVLIGVPMDDGRSGWGAVIRVPRSGARTRAGGQPSIYILAQIWQVISPKRLRYWAKHNLDNSLVLVSYIWMWYFVTKKIFLGGTDTAIGTFICPHRVNSIIGLVTHQKKHSKTLPYRAIRETGDPWDTLAELFPSPDTATQICGSISLAGWREMNKTVVAFFWCLFSIRSFDMFHRWDGTVGGSPGWTYSAYLQGHSREWSTIYILPIHILLS